MATIDLLRPGTLAERQQALLDALFLSTPHRASVDSKFTANYVENTLARGLIAYQSNAHLQAERCMQAVYPVLAQLLGAESFAAFARAFWHSHPPTRGDLSEWGDLVAGFVASSAQLADLPYAADVARVEWALHRCATAADADPDLATLQCLAEQDPGELWVTLAPGLCLVPSLWPVVSIVNAHQRALPKDEAEGGLDLREVRQRFCDGRRETAMVWRQGYKPFVRETLPGEATLLAAVLDGHSLGHALRAAMGAGCGGSSMSPPLDFAAWLPLAVAGGLLLSVAHRHKQCDA